MGRTDLRVSAVGLGCWQFSQGRGLVGAFWPAMSEADVDAVVRASLDAGVDWFDTAEAYGRGASERSLARALQAAGRSPGDVVIATKWTPNLRTSPSIRETFSDRVEALRPYAVDLHQVHHPFGLSPVEAEMRVMAGLIEKHQIRAVGVSNFSAPQLRRAHAELTKHGRVLASNQVRFSLLDRSIERNGVLEVCRELGISIIAYSPLGQGLLSGRYHDDPRAIRQGGLRRFLPAFGAKNLERTVPLLDTLKRVAEEQASTPAEVALAWVLQVHGDLVLAIPGARTSEQARMNARAAELRLTADQVDLLDRASRRTL